MCWEWIIRLADELSQGLEFFIEKRFTNILYLLEHTSWELRGPFENTEDNKITKEYLIKYLGRLYLVDYSMLKINMLAP